MPSLSESFINASQNISVCVNDICKGSPSRIRMVLLISFGMTTLPRSSIRRTIPVAFIYILSLNFQIALLVFVIYGDLYSNLYDYLLFVKLQQSFN